MPEINTINKNLKHIKKFFGKIIKLSTSMGGCYFLSLYVHKFF